MKLHMKPRTLGNYAHLVKAHVWAIIVHRDALWGLTNQGHTVRQLYAMYVPATALLLVFGILYVAK